MTFRSTKPATTTACADIANVSLGGPSLRRSARRRFRLVAIAAALVSATGLAGAAILLARAPADWPSMRAVAWALLAWGLLVALSALLVLCGLRRLQWQSLSIAESRERNRAIVDNMVDGAIHADGQGRIVALNAAAERMFLRESAAVRGESLSILLAPGHRDELEALMREAAEAHREEIRKASELTGLRGDGSAFPLYLALSEVNVGERPVFTAVARDLTETRRRMRELAEARDQALAADRAKSQFLAVMSHEIRTPMNGILGMLDLLRDGNLSSQQREYIDTAEQSGQLLLDLISDILDLSKIEAGKLELQHIDFDLRATVEEVTTLAAGQIRNKDVEVVSYIEPGVPAGVVGDPFRLRQVLMNLTNNAVKFTEQGEVVVQVAVDTAAGPGLRLRFQVRDTGIGIDEEVRRRLFRPFSQGDASTTRRFGGTGLGLVICKRLVNLMGGEIDVESRPGEGSTFRFSVPLEPSADSVETPTMDLRGVRLLIVDDNATNRLILENYLRNWGAESESVEGGAKALTAMRRALDRGTPFSLAILDMQMPEMDGIELAERIKGDAAFGDTRLLMLSSLGFPGAEARRAGIGVSLLKPVRQKMLHDTVLRMLDRRSADGGAKVEPEPRPQFRARVLVAEDNPVNQRVVGLMLRKFGVDVEFADNGRLAVAALAAGHGFDLVFMDVQMPVLNGQDATRAIRAAEAQSARPAIPIVAMTASASVADRDACIDSGMDDFLSKPIQRGSLEAALRRWLPERAMPGA